MSSCLLTGLDANHAVEVAIAMLARAKDMDWIKRDHAHVVVMNPTMRPWTGCTFEEAILFQYSMGPRQIWKHDYKAIALANASASWHSGRPTDELAQLAPHLHELSDAKWYGSVVYRGLIVAVSGLQPWFDVALANAIAGLCVARTIDRWQALVAPSEVDFLREIPELDPDWRPHWARRIED
jgi:hypothetical protein